MTNAGSFTSSLIVATYNWPEALRLVLASVRAQRELPTEVIIADDGSGAPTRDVIANAARGFPVPVRHVWHEDAGFRLGMIRNKAMAAATGEYLIQLDGDLVLHPSFVAGHLRAAKRGWYVQGSRAMLDERATRDALATGRVAAGPFSRGVRNRANAIHAPWLGALVVGATDPMRRTRGCNMAFWRDDIIRVNGYDEQIEGWGREDSELAARLQHAGVRRRNLKFSSVAFHLHHRTQSQAYLNANHAVYERTVATGRVRCGRGISQWVGDTALARDVPR